MILIAYDGSENAKAAIAAAASLMPGAEAVVLTAWEPYTATLARTGASGVSSMSAAAFPDFDKEARVHGERVAAEGAALATNAGLAATARTASTSGSPAGAVLEVAEDLGADAIVVGTRGNGWAKSLVLGSVSHGVVNHSTRPVMVVPLA